MQTLLRVSLPNASLSLSNPDCHGLDKGGARAQIAIMQEDVAMIEDGGKSDFHYGKDWQLMVSRLSKWTEYYGTATQ